MSAAGAVAMLCFQAGLILGCWATAGGPSLLFVGVVLMIAALGIFKVNKLHEDRP